MPTKTTTSRTKKKTTTAKKKQTTKSKSAKTTAKKTTKKKATKKTAAKKPVAKKKPAAKKKTTKRKTTVKKSVKPSSDKTLFVQEMHVKKDIHVFPAKRTMLNQLPVVDLDALPTLRMHKTEEVPHTHAISPYSRLAFYLGMFLGAVVVNAFLVTVLAVMSA